MDVAITPDGADAFVETEKQVALRSAIPLKI